MNKRDSLNKPKRAIPAQVQPVVRWGALWHSKNHRDGITEHLCFQNCLPILFTTRRQCRDWIRTRYGYIKKRADLRKEPHGWRIPRPMKVTITPNAKLSGGERSWNNG